MQRRQVLPSTSPGSFRPQRTQGPALHGETLSQLRGLQRGLHLKVLALNPAVYLNPHPTAYIQHQTQCSLCFSNLPTQAKMNLSLDSCHRQVTWTEEPLEGARGNMSHKSTNCKARWGKPQFRVHRGTQKLRDVGVTAHHWPTTPTGKGGTGFTIYTQKWECETKHILAVTHYSSLTSGGFQYCDPGKKPLIEKQ